MKKTNLTFYKENNIKQASDLNLVNCLLVFLLSGLEETLCVVNHLFETVLLEDREKQGVRGSERICRCHQQLESL